MKKTLLKYKYAVLAGFLLLSLQSCRKDLGNYSYKPLPDGVAIDTSSASYLASYTKVLGKDTLVINPHIAYNGDTTNLTYEWQMWNPTSLTFVTLQKGKKLQYKCGPDSFVPKSGAYTIRLAVGNKNLASAADNPSTNQVYSNTILLTVVNALYRGLLVLHGDGQQCDVGLIEANDFLPKVTDAVTTRVTPNFYSYYNQGAKIPGIGKQVVKFGAVTSFGTTLFGTSNVLIFTDKGGTRTDYLTLKKSPADYSALFLNPADASGKPQYFVKSGQSTTSLAMVDNNRLFYGSFPGPLYSDNFKYSAAPYVLLLGASSGSGTTSSVGVVGFDNLSQSFMYSLYSTAATYVYKFPKSTIANVPFDLNSTNASLVYMGLRAKNLDAFAVLKDNTTQEQYMVDFNFFTIDLSKVIVGRYSMSALPDIGNAKFYAFGGGVNLTYYATGQTIYQYFYQGNNTASPIFTAPAGETITMMKVVKYESSANSTSFYKYSNRLLAVATVDAQGHGKIYAFVINSVTGALTLSSTFNGTETGGGYFGNIYDVDIKDQ